MNNYNEDEVNRKLLVFFASRSLTLSIIIHLLIKPKKKWGRKKHFIPGLSRCHFNHFFLRFPFYSQCIVQHSIAVPFSGIMFTFGKWILEYHISVHKWLTFSFRFHSRNNNVKPKSMGGGEIGIYLPFGVRIFGLWILIGFTYSITVFFMSYALNIISRTPNIQWTKSSIIQCTMYQMKAGR